MTFATERQEIERDIPNWKLRISGPCSPGPADAIETILRFTVPPLEVDESSEVES